MTKEINPTYLKTGHFKKGQKVYQAERLAEVGGYVGEPRQYHVVHILGVIERTVDACGPKKATFYNHGQDAIFGRTFYAPFVEWATEWYIRATAVLATREEALRWLREYYIPRHTRTDIVEHFVLLEGEYTDQEKTWVKDVREAQVKAAAQYGIEYKPRW